MRKVLASLGLLTALWTLGCSITIAVRRPLSRSAVAQVNDEIDGRSATVQLKGEAEAIPVAEMNVGPVATLLRESPRDARPRSVPTAALQQITFMDRSGGAVRGLGIGATLGAILGSLAGAYSAILSCGVSEGHGCNSYIGPVLLGGVLGAAIFGLLGTGIGVAIGDDTTIEFDPPQTRSSPPHEASASGEARHEDCLPGVLAANAKLHHGTHRLSGVVATVTASTRVCVDPKAKSGFRWVRLPDGRSGYAEESDLAF
jgi:hypothetical protein